MMKAYMAERQGFEPWVGANRQRFSRPPHSTTLPPLRGRDRGGDLAGSCRACNPNSGEIFLGDALTVLARGGGWPDATAGAGQRCRAVAGCSVPKRRLGLLCRLYADVGRYGIGPARWGV